MFCISACSRLLKSIAFTMLVAGLTAAQTPAGPKRPAAVPADYVLTPFGYFHPSCVNHLAEGEVVREDLKVIERNNGSTQPLACAYPHFEGDGTKVVGDSEASWGWEDSAALHRSFMD
jgi:hypothetical protein